MQILVIDGLRSFWTRPAQSGSINRSRATYKRTAREALALLRELRSNMTRWGNSG